MSAEEGIFRANDACDNDFTNLSVELQKLACSCSDPSEIQNFQQQKEEFKNDIADYTSSVQKWGKRVAAQVHAKRDQCSSLHASNIVKKNKAIQNFLKVSAEAYKMKRNVSSDK